jgi:hypothetical protein
VTTTTLDIIEERIEHERPDLPVCNCGSCKKLLVSVENKKKYGSAAMMLDTVWFRVRNVPFCRGCASDGEVRYVMDARRRGVS